MNKIAALLLVFTAVLFSGCTQNGQFKGESSMSASSKVTSQSMKSSVETETTFQAKLDDGRPWSPLAIDGSGKIYGFTSTTDISASQILCYDSRTKKTDLIYTAEKGFQPDSLVEYGNYLLWSEYVPPSPSSRMKIVLFDKSAKISKVLNDGAKRQDIQVSQISLGKDLALWAEEPSDSKKSIRSIYQFNLSTQKTSLFRTNADSPALGDNFIAWISPETSNSKNGAVFVQDFATNAIQKITHGENPMQLAAYGDKLVYSGYSNLDCFDPKKKIYESELILYSNGQKKTIETSSDHSYESPNISASNVGWYENSATRIYSIQNDTIITLQQSYGEAFSGGPYIMWTTADPAETKEQAIKDGMYTVKINILKMH